MCVVTCCQTCTTHERSEAVVVVVAMVVVTTGTPDRRIPCVIGHPVVPVDKTRRDHIIPARVVPASSVCGCAVAFLHLLTG